MTTAFLDEVRRIQAEADALGVRISRRKAKALAAELVAGPCLLDHADPTGEEAVNNVVKEEGKTHMTITTSTFDVRRLSRLRAWCVSGRAREIRRRAHLSQIDVANAIGVNQSLVSTWEAGAHMPSANETASRYLELLENLAIDTATR